ncbi:MAG TPA: hypothetical protein IAC41_06950, partial [Candidatus Merdenecus merdavium]|nr:hypothetical protein [Candidatus Merdenecus merdavium]
MKKNMNRLNLYKKKGKTSPLGASIEKRGINFAFFYREICERVYLLLYKKGEEEPCETVEMMEEGLYSGIYSIYIEGLDPKEYEYNFLVHKKILQDPYAKCILGREHFGVERTSNHQVRCGFDTSPPYLWEEDHPLYLPFEQVISYNLNVRSFTMHRNSKVKNKGTFKGLIEKIPYFKELGINQIELMPAYEFEEVEFEKNNHHMVEAVKTPLDRPYAMIQEESDRRSYKVNAWGYTEGNYFVPKAAYAATKNPSKEFKDMVKAFHKNGIEVIMEFYFPKGIDPYLIAQCLRFWIQDYHMDGFHLNGIKEYHRILAQDPYLKNVKLMGDFFLMEERSIQDLYHPYRNLAEYNDGFKNDIRQFLKGDAGVTLSFLNRMKKNPIHQTVMNYITSHDGFTLMDLVSYNEKHNEENGEHNLDGTDHNYSWNCGIEGKTSNKKVNALRRRQIKNAFVMVLLSQGTPLILGGDELGNSQEGNNNGYCQDNKIGWVNWQVPKKDQWILPFVKELIQFRKGHFIFLNKKEYTNIDTLTCGYPEISYHTDKAWFGGLDENNHFVGVMYCGDYGVDEQGCADDFIYIAYNMHWEDHSFALPKLPNKMA